MRLTNTWRSHEKKSKGHGKRVFADKFLRRYLGHLMTLVRQPRIKIETFQIAVCVACRNFGTCEQSASAILLHAIATGDTLDAVPLNACPTAAPTLQACR